MARTSNNRVISSVHLYCCWLPQCEALRTCHSGFPISNTVTQWTNVAFCLWLIVHPCYRALVIQGWSDIHHWWRDHKSASLGRKQCGRGLGGCAGRSGHNISTRAGLHCVYCMSTHATITTWKWKALFLVGQGGSYFYPFCLTIPNLVLLAGHGRFAEICQHSGTHWISGNEN